ncbi:Proteinase regulatory CLIP domain [Trinorchestia longiramus]|nr:Proteinase regulatory CLIP domain [Trinorchestia longiramus]
MRKRLKKIKASKVASSELSLNKVESLTTNHLHKEFPKPESAPSFSDILRPELGSLFDRVEHASVQLLQTVLKQQLPLEEYTGNSIQDSFFGSSPASQAYQPEVGGSCFSSLGEPGMCVPVEDCPQLRPLTKQLHVKNAVILLVQQLCRLGEENFFVCCEYPAFQNPPYAVGSANAVLPRFQKSLFGAPLPSEGECGVVGPQPADEDGQHRQLESHEWPWLVAIGRILDREAFNVLCSGTLFTRRHVLTAASCFYLQEIRQPTMVRVGEHDTSVREGNAHQDFLIIGRNDPGWVLFFNQENLMVLTLERDITFSEYVQPACLPPPDISVPDVGSSVASASWKRSRRARNVSEDSQPPSPVLASLEVVSLRECQTAYSNLEANFFLVDARNICVVEEETSPQCCVSVGAPVMKKRDDGAYELVGVVTVPSIPTQYVPTVGTRVSAYRDWLEYVVEG